MTDHEIIKESEILAQISNTLRSLRLNAGFTQQQIADFLHTSRSSYSYYELGTIRPSIAVLYSLSRLYGVPVDSFFTSPPDSPPTGPKAWPR